MTKRRRLELLHLPADALGLAPWARAALAHRPQPAELPGMILPADLDGFPLPDGTGPEPGERFPPDAREALAESLERALARVEPHVNVLESVRAIAHPQATLVLAGQQPGFLGGPLLNVYKSVHAIRLARALSKRSKTPVVPAFWNHADDHDIAEVHHLWVQNSNLDLQKVTLAGASSGRVPFSGISFDTDRHRLTATAELLRQNLWEGERKDEMLELFLPRDGESFAGAFTRVLLSLFGHHGLVVIEPEWIRAPLSRALARVVAGDVRAGLEAGTGALRASGSEPAIDPDGAALVYHLKDGKRHALRLTGDDFRYDDEAGSRTGTELAAEIVQEPSSFSAGALLRPLAQDLALPVAAYVGGWGELAYHVQLPPLRREIGVPVTPFVPRLSVTLVEPETLASLEKLELTVLDALRARGALTGEGEGQAVSEVAQRLRAIGSDTAARIRGEKEALVALDRGLAQQTKKLSSQVEDLIERLAGKAERVEANARGRGKRHFRRIQNGLFPRDTPQERVRGPLEVAARHGLWWIDELVEEVDPLPTEHLVVTLPDG